MYLIIVILYQVKLWKIEKNQHHKEESKTKLQKQTNTLKGIGKRKSHTKNNQQQRNTH